MTNTTYRNRLLGTSLLVGTALLSTPASAQDRGTTSQSTQPQNQSQSTGGAPQAGTPAPAVPVQNVNAPSTSRNEEIVITGTLFRRTNTETPSPVTVLSSETLARRGITTVNDAVRSISADNAGSIPTAFTNGFGGGGAAAALRGLTVNSTLTLVDGLRMVSYPLADDGQRAFVDLNTIPRVAIDRIEVLKDGASSTYGADAIGGVVNVIMRKQFNGLDANLEGGITERGDGAHYRGTILAGAGDYDAQGFNIYAGLEYERDNQILTRDRGFPFNTADLTAQGGVDLNWAPFVNGSSSMGPVAVVAPATQTDPTNPLSGAQIPDSASVVLNPSQCAAFSGTLIAAPNGGQSCEINQYQTQRLTIQPRNTRYGGTVRASARIDDHNEAYVMASFYRTEGLFWPLYARTRSTNPINTTGLVLPAVLSNGQLDPYDPFANATCAATVAGCPAALIRFRFPNLQRESHFDSNVFRGAAGINGDFWNSWHYQVDVAAMTSNLHRRSTGNIFEPALINAINTGTYNFANPLATPANVVTDILRNVESTSTSQLYLAQGFVSDNVTQLAGGPLQIGVGAQIRREELDNPNQNPANQYIDVNQVFARGQRTVKAAFFEIAAPIIKQLEVNVSGRYDTYSTGFHNFSPKAGFKFTPIPQLAFRGTFSRGFRAPSFAESGEAGVIGFVTATPPCVVRLQHGATGTSTSCTAGNQYVAPQALGFNSSANPNLRPEKSRNFTLGFVAQPIRELSFTFDYYNIKKTDVITQGPLSNQALNNFYNGLPLPAGYSVVTYPVDPAFPAATPVVAIINSPYVNAASIQTSGFDASILFQKRFAPSVRFSSQLEATKIIKFNLRPCQDTSDPGCAVQHYAGTLGPYQLSSGAGTPAWRGNWSNSLEWGPATITGTAYYVSSYWDYSEDTSTPPVTNKCAAAGELYSESFCKTKQFIWVDLVGSYKLSDNITLYGSVLNLFNARAPIEPANYAGPQANYNPTWHQAGAIGRAYRLGVNFTFHPRPHVEAAAPIVAPPPPPPAAPATITCPDGLVILAGQQCPVPPPPPPPPAPAPERG
ncbi:MAG: TonB-dependent receptor plug domain-containing protein [Sphingomonas sp.]